MRCESFVGLGMNVIHTDSMLGWKFTWTKDSLFMWTEIEENDWRVSSNLSKFADTSKLSNAVAFCQSLCEVTKMDSVIEIKSHNL